MPLGPMAQPPKMRYLSRLAFDPGHNTGIAYAKDGKIVFTACVHYSIMDGGYLEELITVLDPGIAIVEEVPNHNPDKVTASLYHRILFYLQDAKVEVRTVNPGIWKPLRKKAVPYWNEHLKDAVGLIEYLDN